MKVICHAAAGAALLLFGGAMVASAQPDYAHSSGSMASPMSAGGFVDAAAMSDTYEIQAGTIASTNASSLEIKNFAQQMIHDHTMTSAQLQRIAGANGVRPPPPAQLDARHRAMLDQLRQAGKQNFDRIYVSQQIAAHQEALALMQNYAQNGSNPALKGFAAKTAPTIQQHLTMAHNLKLT